MRLDRLPTFPACFSSLVKLDGKQRDRFQELFFLYIYRRTNICNIPNVKNVHKTRAFAYEHSRKWKNCFYTR